MVKNVLDGKFDEACSGLKQLYDLGYSPTDIITTLFRVIKNYDMAEFLKLELLKVNPVLLFMPLSLLIYPVNSTFMFLRAGDRICAHEDL